MADRRTPRTGFEALDRDPRRATRRVPSTDRPARGARAAGLVGPSGVALAAGLLLATPLAGQNWATAQFARQISVEERAEVSIQYSSGTLILRGEDSGQLYGMRVRYDADTHVPVHRFEGGAVTLGVERVEGASFLRSRSHGGEMELTLSNRIPMDLRLNFGAVRARVDVGGLQLTGLALHTGASDGELRASAPNPVSMEEVRLTAGAASFRALELGNLNAARIVMEAGVGDFRLDLSGLQRAETEVVVKMGFGSLQIRVPPEAGVWLVRESFLAPLDAPGLERRGDEYVSPNWDQATQRVRVSVEAALGSISVLRTEP